MNERIEPKETAHQSDQSIPEGIASTQARAIRGKDQQSLHPRLPRFEIGRQDNFRPKDAEECGTACGPRRPKYTPRAGQCSQAANESALQPGEVKDEECGACNPRADCPQPPIYRVNAMER